MKLDTDRLVTAPVLLRELFPDPECRRSLRWLQYMRTKRVIPYFKVGHGVFFDPEKVRAALIRKNYIREL